MTLSTIDTQSLFTDLANGLTLVTGNSRLARVMGTRYGQWRIEQGDSQWQSPDILSWGAWLNGLWEDAGLQGIEGTGHAVPGSHQLLTLWERTLRDDPRARQLLRPESLAARLRDTRKLAIQWQLDMSHSSWFGDENENHAAFHHWNRTFEALCLRENWLPPEDRLALISNAIQDGQLVLSGNIGLLGFDEFNPAQQQFLDVLAKSGMGVVAMILTPAESSPLLWKSRDNKN
jgi:ATP-dependent helicase/nuclease subunit B